MVSGLLGDAPSPRSSKPGPVLVNSTVSVCLVVPDVSIDAVAVIFTLWK